MRVFLLFILSSVLFTGCASMPMWVQKGIEFVGYAKAVKKAIDIVEDSKEDNKQEETQNQGE